MPEVGLDIGHGVNTFPPSKGVTVNGVGYAEHTFNSQVAIQMEKRLKDHKIGVFKAQEPYRNDVALTTRTNLYNNRKVDLVWSIHANAGRSEVKGIGAFYWNTSQPCKRLAEIFIQECRNAKMDIWGTGLFGGVRGTWTDLHMIRETKMTAVLAEYGFMTNSVDFQRIFKNPEYVKTCAEVSVKAICRFLNIAYKPLATSTPTPTPAPTQPKEENKLEKQAIVVNSFADFPNAEPLSNKLKCGIFTRKVAEQRQVAEEIIVCGGSKDKLVGSKFVVLSGPNRYATGQAIEKYYNG